MEWDAALALALRRALAARDNEGTYQTYAITAGRDEYLEKAIEVLEHRI